jgi:hypothetical protein
MVRADRHHEDPPLAREALHVLAWLPGDQPGQQLDPEVLVGVGKVADSYPV